MTRDHHFRACGDHHYGGATPACHDDELYVSTCSVLHVEAVSMRYFEVINECPERRNRARTIALCVGDLIGLGYVIKHVSSNVRM